MAEVAGSHAAEPITSDVSVNPELRTVIAGDSFRNGHSAEMVDGNCDTALGENPRELVVSATNEEQANGLSVVIEESAECDSQRGTAPSKSVPEGVVASLAIALNNVTESPCSDDGGAVRAGSCSSGVGSVHDEAQLVTETGSRSLTADDVNMQQDRAATISSKVTTGYTLDAAEPVTEVCSQSGQCVVPATRVNIDCVDGENSDGHDLREVHSCEPADPVSLSDDIPTPEDELPEERVNAGNDEATTNLVDNTSSGATMVENPADGDADISTLDDCGLSAWQEVLECESNIVSENAMVSEGEQMSAKSDGACDEKASTAATINRPVKPREPSFRERLGSLKEGIKSATKDNSHIREAFGQMKLGIRSAISETSMFLEGPPTQRSRCEIPAGHGHTAGSTSAVQHVTAPAPRVPNVQPHLVAEEEESIDVGVTAAPVTTAPVVDAPCDGAGDVMATRTLPVNDFHEDDLLSELDAELDDGCRTLEQETEIKHPAVTPQSPSIEPERIAPPPRPPPPNGLRHMVLTEIVEFKEMKATCEKLRLELQQQKDQCTRVLSVHEAQDDVLVKLRQETETYKKEIQDLKSKATTDDTVYSAHMKVLEMTIASQQKELSATQEKLVTLDKASKDAVAKLQVDLRTRVEQLTSVNEATKREKADMVLKYARAEAKNIEMEQKMVKNDARIKEMAKERDSVLSKCKTLKADQVKCRELFESRSTEVVMLKRELEKQKEQFVSQEGKTKWAHNKLRQEIESHKETRGKMEEAQRKNKVARDEAEQIRRDCQAMIKTYQESEEIKSNCLDLELKHKETELMHHKQEKIDHQEVHNLVRRELDTFKMKHKEMFEELKTWRDKVQCLDAERVIQEKNLNKYRETLQSQKETNQTLQRRLLELEDIEDVMIEVKTKSGLVEQRNGELERECLEVRADMEQCGTREQEHLQFTQKISDKNAHLQAENTALANKVTGLTAENERVEALCTNLTNKKEALEKAIEKEKTLRVKCVGELTTQLAERTATVDRLTVDLDDTCNELKTLKRKHAANTKDLTRQLQSIKRRLELMEPKDNSSMGSRTPSNGSLDTVSGGRTASNSSHPVVEPEPFVEIVEVDKQMLIEKIVRLQKAHARKNEKLEFMEDHIQQLFTEVQKKTKVIQYYALREEAGTISSDSADANKALLAKKGGIMASLYTSHQQDGAMNLDLSLDINRKLQAVLEDTLLKNITLKENLDTLGEEIARLSKENRAIQLSRQT